MRVYRIYDRVTQKFKDEGGGYEKPENGGWSRNGKIWKTLGHVKSHIRHVMQYEFVKNDRYELVEYELIERDRMKLNDATWKIILENYGKSLK